MIVRIGEEKYQLDANIPVEDKLIAVNEILQTKMVFMELEMSVEEYFLQTWDNPNTKKAMDLLSYYLTKVTYDKTTLSRKKMKEISRGSDRHVPFSSLGIEHQQQFGLQDT